MQRHSIPSNTKPESIANKGQSKQELAYIEQIQAKAQSPIQKVTRTYGDADSPKLKSFVIVSKDFK